MRTAHLVVADRAPDIKAGYCTGRLVKGLHGVIAGFEGARGRQALIALEGHERSKNLRIGVIHTI